MRSTRSASKRTRKETEPAPPARPRVTDAWAVALLVALVTLLYADVLFLGRTPYFRDLAFYHFPMKQVLRELITSGHFPWWNPFHASGQPLAANPAWEVFYPPQWLILLPGTTLGFRFHIIFHIYLAALGMYAFLRDLDLRIGPAVAGAVVFTMGGLIQSLSSLLPFLFTVAWWPLIFLFARRFFRDRRRSDFGVTSLLLGLQALVGEPVVVLQTWALVAAWSIYAWYHSPERSAPRLLGRNVALAAALAGAGLLVAAVQIIPAVDHARDSVRSEPFEWEHASAWSLPPVRAIEIVVPSIFRSLPDRETGEPWQWHLYPESSEPYLPDLYLGLLPVLMTLVFLATPGRGRLLLLLVAVPSYLLALGSNGPLLRPLYDAGLFANIRFPEKFALPLLFALVVAAAAGLDRFPRASRGVRTLVITLALGVAAIALFQAAGARAQAEVPIPPGVDVEIDPFEPRAFWLGVAARAGIVVALLALAGRLRHFWFVVVIVFLVADLQHLRRDLMPTMPERFFEPPPLAAQLKDFPGRLFHEADWQWYEGAPVAKRYFAVTSDPGYWWTRRNGLFPRIPAAWDIATTLEDDVDSTLLLRSSRLLEQMHALRRRGDRAADTILAMSNVTSRAVFRPPAPQVMSVPAEERSPVAIRTSGGQPRFAFARKLVSIRDADDFAYRLRGENATTAFVEGVPFEPSEGTLRVIDQRPHRVAIETDTAGQAFLVASITTHKWWSATIDGRPAPIIPTNLAYQGIVVPPGRHLVELRYANRLIAPSAALSLLAIGALLTLAFRRRRTPVT